MLVPPSPGRGIYAATPLRSYTTNFTGGNENPLSEGGKFTAAGSNWTPISVSSALAVGNQDNSGGFDDSNTCLSGYTPNHKASITIHKASPSGGMELEILLRWSISATDTHGYECNLAHNGNYSEIVRWNGALGSFTYLTNGGSSGGGSGAAPNDGDIFSATILGTRINTYLNGVLRTTVDIVEMAQGGSVWTTGQPGFGEFRNAGAASSTYCVSSFSAIDL